MPYIITRARRDRQPVGYVGIDDSNWFARGLTLAYTPTARIVDQAYSKPATLSGITNRMEREGRSFSGSAAVNDGVDFGSYRPITSSTDWTVAVLATPAQTVGQQTGMFSQRSGTGNVEQINLMRGTSNLLADDERDFQVYYRNTAASPYYADNGTTHVNGPDGNNHLWGGSCTSSVLDIWRDAVNVTENRTTPSGTFVSSSQTTRLGNLGSFSASGKYAANCPMYLTLVWGARALTAAEWRELNEYRWQVFKPIVRRSYFAVASTTKARYYYDMIFSRAA